MRSTPPGTRMPAIFFGHGSPLNELDGNVYVGARGALGATLPRPGAVLSISAPWYGAWSAVTGCLLAPLRDEGGLIETFAPRDFAPLVAYDTPGSDAVSMLAVEIGA